MAIAVRIQQLSEQLHNVGHRVVPGGGGGGGGDTLGEDVTDGQLAPATLVEHLHRRLPTHRWDTCGQTRYDPHLNGTFKRLRPRRCQPAALLMSAGVSLRCKALRCCRLASLEKRGEREVKGQKRKRLRGAGRARGGTHAASSATCTLTLRLRWRSRKYDDRSWDVRGITSCWI